MVVGGLLGTVGDGLVIVLMLLGALTSLVAAIGLVRLPDTVSRMHATAKPATFGLLCFCAAGMLRADADADRLRLVVVVLLVALSTPVSAHLLSSAITEHEAPKN
jgi:multicomponent Na+:H+ antiporter subunit G